MPEAPRSTCRKISLSRGSFALYPLLSLVQSPLQVHTISAFPSKLEGSVGCRLRPHWLNHVSDSEYGYR
jgi:hypothetical protein